MFRWVWIAICSCWLLAACDESSSSSPRDSAPPDDADSAAEPGHDGGSVGGSAIDAGLDRDAGPGEDGGATSDGGSRTDGGAERDSGSADGGGVDGGAAVDAGSDTDAGLDAESASDASPDGATDGGDGTDAAQRVDSSIEVGPLVRLEIEPADVFLAAVGDERQLIARGYDELGNEVPLEADELDWDIANEWVATVDEAGWITATSRGGTLIWLGYESFTATAGVVVEDVLAEMPGFALEDIDSGDDHSCGTDASGKAYCWGEGDHGRLGNGDTQWSHWPSPVEGDLVLHGLAAGFRHTCALDVSGAAYCWGQNTGGQIGVPDDELEESVAPVPVSGGLTFTQISVGHGHTCALETGGKAYCFGHGGALGDGDDDWNREVFSPTPVVGDLSFREIHAGSASTCALTRDGIAYCWGDNGYGQLGLGTVDWEDSSAVPVPVTGGHVFEQLDVHDSRVCALTVGGEVWCWGANFGVELGDGSFEDSGTPLRVNTEQRFVELRVSWRHSCGRTSAGEVWCWGQNEAGQLGDGSTDESDSPVKVIGDLAFTRITLGTYFSCGLAAGGAYCWGDNGRNGLLGAGFVDASFLHVSVVPWPLAGPDKP